MSKPQPGRSDASASRAPAARPSRHARLDLHRRERRALLAAVDLILLNLALLIYVWQRGAGVGLPADRALTIIDVLTLRPHWFVILSCFWLPIAHAFDAYRLQRANRVLDSVTTVWKSAAFVLVAYLAVPYLTPALPDARRHWLLFFGTAFLLLGLGRVVCAAALGRRRFRRGTLIIGASWAGQTIGQVLLQHDDGTHRIVGFIDEDETLHGRRVAPVRTAEQHAPVMPIEPDAFKVLGGRDDLKQIIREQRIRTLVLAIPTEIEPGLLQVLTDCLELGVEIVPMAQLYERLTGRVPVEHVAGDWHVAMPIEHPGTGTLRPLIKRLFDLAAASVGLLLLLPFVPFIAAAIRIESPGPVFYTQERLGKGGRRFRVIKFRSMRADAEEGTAVWSQAGDPRVTRVGKFLRATHLDEFPQFVNILKGDMSAVGPRPERPEFLEHLAAEIPFYTVRHAVKPGMAGWALVNAGYGSSTEDALIKLQYDLYYIKHQSLPLDIVILLKTVLRSVGLQGR